MPNQNHLARSTSMARSPDGSAAATSRVGGRWQGARHGPAPRARAELYDSGVSIPESNPFDTEHLAPAMPSNRPRRICEATFTSAACRFPASCARYCQTSDRAPPHGSGPCVPRVTCVPRARRPVRRHALAQFLRARAGQGLKSDHLGPARAILHAAQTRCLRQARKRLIAMGTRLEINQAPFDVTHSINP